jgi:hypothetical protein
VAVNAALIAMLALGRRDILMAEVVRWCIERYYRAD